MWNMSGEFFLDNPTEPTLVKSRNQLTYINPYSPLKDPQDNSTPIH